VVDLGDDAGLGMDNMDSSELRIPFLYLLQANSPQVAEPVGQGAGVPGAKAGMFMDSSTGELYESPIALIPCSRDEMHKFLEKTPQALGGGLVAVYEPNDPIVLELKAKHGKFGKLPRNVTRRDDKGQALDGTELQETFTLGGIFVPNPESGKSPFKALLSFKSTQIPKYQSMMGRLKNSIVFPHPDPTKPAQKPAVFSLVWKLESVYESNAKGKFYGMNLTLWAKNTDGTEMRPINSLTKKLFPELYEESKAFYEFLRGNASKVNYKNEAGGETVKPGDDVPM
jgi:hypothetical protein